MMSELFHNLMIESSRGKLVGNPGRSCAVQWQEIFSCPACAPRKMLTSLSLLLHHDFSWNGALVA